jgi:hypothetical protein
MKSKADMPRTLGILLLLVTLSCAGRPPRDTFVTYMQSDPGRLDPFYSTDVVSGRVLAMLCDGLFRLDREGRLQPDLLESFTFDGLVLRGRLHRNVRVSSRRGTDKQRCGVFTVAAARLGEPDLAPPQRVYGHPLN